MKYILIFLLFLCLIACKKEEKIYYPEGNPKYINERQGNILNINRYDKQGNLIFKGKFKDFQLIDTLYVYDESDDESFIKMNNSDESYFYGTYILKYPNGKIAKVSNLRFKKGIDLDSVIGSSKLIGKEIIYNQSGNVARETIYKIVNDSSVVTNENVYDKSFNR